MLTVLIAAFWIGFVFIGVLLIKDSSQNHQGDLGGASAKKWIWSLGIGIFANFLDTLGCGSFAPSTFLYKAGSVADDVNIPGTLNVGDTFPVIFEALLFTSAVDVEPVFLVVMIVAAAIGSFSMANIVTKWPRNKIRYAVGVAMIGCAIVMAMRNAGVGPFGEIGTAVGLSGWKFIVAVVLNFVFGALMDIGFGLYAPCMATCLLLGMDGTACFPVFMGSCALLMIANSPVFIKRSRYDLIAVWGNVIGGIFGVYLAYTFVTSLSIKTLIYLICIVLLYTAFSMFRDARNDVQKKVME